MEEFNQNSYEKTKLNFNARVDFFSDWIKEIIRWKKIFIRENDLTSLTPASRIKMRWTMMKWAIMRMDDESLEKFKTMAPNVEIEKRDDIIKLIVRTKHFAIEECKRYDIPYDKNLWAIEWMINDLEKIQEYFHDMPFNKLPKYVTWLSYIAGKLKMLWFDIIDLWENVDRTEHARILNPHPLKKTMLTTQIKTIWFLTELLAKTPFIRNKLRNKISRMENRNNTNREREKTVKRYEKKDIKLALMPMNKFLWIDFKRTMKERKVIMKEW